MQSPTHSIAKFYGSTLEITYLQHKKSHIKRMYTKKDNENEKSDTGRFFASLSRSRTRIRELVQNNFVAGSSVFLTLTYAEHISKDDYDRALLDFDNFRRKLKKQYPSIKYLAVSELTKKGRIHFHILLDQKYISQKWLAQIWQKGFVFIVPTHGNTQKLAFYISKYISKDVFVSFGNKTYLRSSNLENPLIVRGLFEVSNFVSSILQAYTVAGSAFGSSFFSGENDFFKWERSLLVFSPS